MNKLNNPLLVAMRGRFIPLGLIAALRAAPTKAVFWDHRVGAAASGEPPAVPAAPVVIPPVDSADFAAAHGDLYRNLPVASSANTEGSPPALGGLLYDGTPQVHYTLPGNGLAAEADADNVQTVFLVAPSVPVDGEANPRNSPTEVLPPVVTVPMADAVGNAAGDAAGNAAGDPAGNAAADAAADASANDDSAVTKSLAQEGEPAILVPLEEKSEVVLAASLLDITLGDAGNMDRWVVVQRDGMPNQQFSCGLNDTAKLYRVSAAIAASDIMITSGSSEDLEDNDDINGFWNGLSPWMNMWRDRRETSNALELTAVSVNVLDPTVLEVYTQPSVAAGGLLLGNEDSIRVVYVCQSEGQSTVRFNATTAAGDTVCLQWTKQCQPSWTGMKILQAGTGLTVWENNKPNQEWLSVAEETARAETANAAPSNSMSFVLTHPMSDGTVRIKSASVTSDTPGFNVTVRGVLHGENVEPLSIGNDDAEQLDVVYQCVVDDDNPQMEAMVTLTLTNESPTVEPLTFSWPAVCGRGILGGVTAFVSSCSVAGIPGGTLLKDSMALTDGIVAGDFSSAGNPITIAENDDCTAFTFSTANGSMVELFPRHQLTYDKKIVRVSNKVGSVETSLTGNAVLRIPYYCVADGTSQVQLTVHFKDRPSTDFVWNKRCLEPKVHHGGISGSTVVGWLLAILLTGFLLLFFSRSRTLSRFLCRKLYECFCCARARSTPLSDERAQFTTFGAAV